MPVFEEAMASFLRTATRRMRNHTRDRVLFRSATPGQVDCASYRRPFAKPTDFEPRPGGTANFSYMWHLHPAFNAIAARQVAAAVAADGSLGGRLGVLDVYTMTTMRPDGRHGGDDCLHFWLPGVPDWWVHLLLARLRAWSEPAGSLAGEAAGEAVGEVVATAAGMPAGAAENEALRAENEALKAERAELLKLLGEGGGGKEAARRKRYSPQTTS